MRRMTTGRTDVARIAEIDHLAERELADTGLPGLALALTGTDGPPVVRTRGLSDIAARRPVEPDTLFEIGSIGKTFTAIVILQLAEEGRLDLGAPVVDALPWFEVPVVGRPITIHDLLTHTAGITVGIDGTPEAASQVWALRDRRPGSAPGERFHYSNLGYKTLGLVIEAVEGRRYPEVIQTRILGPLGMAATEPAITNDVRPRLAVGYDYLHDDRIGYPGRPLAPATWVETATADGSIASTAGDMAAFARMILRRGEGPHGRLLGEASFARMATPHARPTPTSGYGYALATRVLDGRTFLGHPGGMIGYLAGSPRSSSRTA
jgi:CubicO group peptidase (beta-lactamase class C family)